MGRVSAGGRWIFSVVIGVACWWAVAVPAWGRRAARQRAAALRAMDFAFQAAESIANGELSGGMGVEGVEDGGVDAGEVEKGPVTVWLAGGLGLLGFSGDVSCGEELWIVRVRPLHV